MKSINSEKLKNLVSQFFFAFLCNVISTIMAIAIKSIPTLKNDAAKAFVQNAEAATSKRGTVNFSKQVASTRTILKKARLK